MCIDQHHYCFSFHNFDFPLGFQPTPPLQTSTPRNLTPYEPRATHRSNPWQPGEILPSDSSSLSSHISGRSSFESSLGGDDLPLPGQNDIEKLWEDVQSLVRHSFESVQRNVQDICHRMEQMEQKMSSLQALVNEQFSDSLNDKGDQCGTTHKRKRKTPVTLQVHVHMYYIEMYYYKYVVMPFICIFRMQ